MKFRTEYEAKKSTLTLDPSKPVVLLGSCFSQNMAAKMESHQWKAVNPLGTLYNPESIALALYVMLDEKNWRQKFENSLFEHNGLWNSSYLDSSFSSSNREDCIQEFINRKKLLTDALNEGKTLIVTFGTSIVYYRKENREPAGNCHKLPAEEFYKKRLTYIEVASFWDVMAEELQKRFPGIKIIFTVSPVRHLKDGFEGNARSKSVLLLGIEEILKYNEGCYYFPAYEILNDDLRDYRFYASDLTHPSDEAVEYIWDKFKATFIDDKGLQLLEEGLKRNKALQHRPKTGALGKPLNQI